MIWFLECLHLVDVHRDPVTNEMIDCNNLTLLNFILIKMGPLKEETLVIYVLFVQIMCSILGFIVRYGLVHVVYNKEE